MPLNYFVAFAFIFLYTIPIHKVDAQSIPQSGLVASYSFNGNTNDATVYGNHGSLGGANLPYTTTDRFGVANAAYQLGGCGNLNWIRVPNSLSLQFSKKLTVSLWFKQCDFAGMSWGGVCVPHGGWKMLYAKAGDAYTANPGFYCGTSVSSSNKLTVFHNNKNCWGACPFNYTSDTSANCVDTCEWVHLVNVIDSNQWKMYFNGQLIKQKTISVVDFSGANTQDLYFGRMFPGNWYPFGGTLDDINIYNKALNQAQIDSLYGNFFNNYGVNISPTPALICNGSSVNLSASGAVSYSWGPSSSLNTLIGPNVIANPTTTSTYLLTYVDSNGCTGNLSKTVTVNPTQSFVLNQSICQGQSYAGYSVSGNYIDTFQNVYGCDSIRTINLTVNLNTSNTTTLSACNSYVWPVNSQTYPSSGIYTSTSLNASGCLHTGILNLTINSSTSNTTTLSACNAYTWPVNSQTYTNSGIYTATSLNANGCLHTESLNLTINNSSSNTTTLSSCNTYTWPINSQTYTSSGIYTSTSLNAGGCLHTDILNLTINSSTSNTTTLSACNAYTWPINSQTYTSSGIYTSTSLNANGCLHTESLNLTINNSSSNTTTLSSCNTYTWPINSQTYTSSGIYTSTSLNANGCLHTESLNLTINSSTSNTTTLSSCNTYTWPINSQTYTSSGIYTSTSLNANGCLHTESLNLTINNSSSNTTTLSSCNTYTWPINSQTYTSSGIYTSTSLNANGCLHTESLNLTINNSSSNTTTLSSCNTYTWPINSQTYTSSGIYTSTSLNASGCLHTESLNLTINSSTSNTTTLSSCNTYTWPINSQTYTSSGIYTSTSLNANGCLHTESLNLTINNSSSNTTTLSSCNTYTWPINSQTYTSSGIYTSTSLNTNGCLHTESLNLTINNSSSNTTTLSSCNTYTWPINSQTYTSSGIYTSTSLNASGCLHTDILNLTINNSTSNSSTISTCNSYIWPINSQTYTVSGVYTSSSLNSNGCLHTDILNLTINNSSFTTATLSACNTYTWPINSQTYTVSGIYTSTSLNSSGCLHTDSLNLTINNSSSNTTTLSACNTYFWPINSQTFTSSGIYTSTSLNSSGCLHTAILNLTINNTSSNSTTLSACNTYFWPINSQTYTVSGVYTFTSLTTGGCLHTEIIDLSINTSTFSTTTLSACNPYIWPINSQTYTVSGVYTSSSLNSNGCLHTDILNLTINNSSFTTATLSACNTYTWPINSQTYTVSGIYTSTSLNSSGCLHTDSLNLTINNSSSNTTTLSACNTYFWPINSQTFTSSGIYTSTSLNSSGCLHTAILNLTINNTSSNSTTLSACNTYFWPINSQTYTVSGVYTFTSLTTGGCLHTEIIDLSINTSTFSTTTLSACNPYIWPINSQTYTVSGVYTSSSLNSNGCLHTNILNLTINSSTSNSSTISACNSYIWPANSQTYTSSGIYTSTSLNANGCLHTDILNLSINNTSSNTVNLSACNTYVWPINSQSYTASGTYTYTTLSSNGCLHSEILNLTINNSSSNTTTLSSCNTYLWPMSSQGYTVSGIYTFTSLNVNGCLHTDILDLTINTSTSNTTNLSACNTYTWPINSQTYTVSGIYTFTSLNTSGCLHTDILDLSINTSTSSITALSVCNTYTWPINSQTYTNSGIYTSTSIAAGGCLHTDILDLSINKSSSNTTTLSACDTYTWLINSQTYIVSGNYTFTSLNSSGCQHTDILELTINASTSNTTSLSACDTYTWPINSQSYTASGNYTYTSLSSNGCLHSDILALTINELSITTLSKEICQGENYMGYSKPGKYTDSFKNINGCDSIRTLILGLDEITCCKFFIPNAFSPNGDGINDEFRVVGQTDYEIFEFVILNRWGQIVNKVSNPQIGWDGKFKGEECPNGTYFYLLNYQCIGKGKAIEKGDLILIR